eukprot:541201_1
MNQSSYFDDIFVDGTLDIRKSEYTLNILKDILHNHVLLQKDFVEIVHFLDTLDIDDEDFVNNKIELFTDLKCLLEQQIEYVGTLMEYYEDEETFFSFWNDNKLKEMHKIVYDNNVKIELFHENDIKLPQQIRYKSNHRRYQDGGGGNCINEKAVLAFSAEFVQCSRIQTLIIVHSAKGRSFENISEQTISGLKYHSSYDAPSGNNKETSFMDINAETDLVCCDLSKLSDDSKKAQIIKDAMINVKRYVEAVDGEPCMDGYISAIAYPPEDETSMLTPFFPQWQYKATMAAPKDTSHPHRSYFDHQMKWIEIHSLTIKKVCLAIDVNICNYHHEYKEMCNYEHCALGINIGIPKDPKPRGWHTKMDDGTYVSCLEDEVIFDRSSTKKKFLYENPTCDPIKAEDIQSWGIYAPYNKFMDIIQANIVEYYTGSINQFNQHNLTSTIAQQWPSNLQYSSYVRNNLTSFHKQYGPHLADIERQLCHIMHYKNTITSIQTHQRIQYFATSGISDKINIIVKNRWDINNGVENEDVNKLHQEYGVHYEKDNFYVLLRALIKTIPARIVKQWDTKRRDEALYDESTWMCKVCHNVVEDETDDNDVDIPHPACEICFEWYHVQCSGIDAKILKDKKNIFLCAKHSGNGKFVIKPKKGFKY